VSTEERPSFVEGIEAAPAAEQIAPAPEDQPEPTAQESKELRRICSRFVVRAGETIRALRLPDADATDTEAWIVSDKELADIVPSLERGVESIGIGEGVLAYGPALLCGFALMGYATRSVVAERKWKEQNGNRPDRDAVAAGGGAPAIESGAGGEGPGDDGFADWASRSGV
jgi:hypothetical protein